MWSSSATVRCELQVKALHCCSPPIAHGGLQHLLLRYEVEYVLGGVLEVPATLLLFLFVSNGA
ncbi:hypothetical protein CDL15_Pgr008515 [Punica granatum]|uniref:Uncharacterized protein n=1 Tax=Punica granatum TaxID=22663 RepID=A0A218WQD9_PUNGR|nr:hypothetical protein CDL15_Pgr008515 [Punica granatum]